MVKRPKTSAWSSISCARKSRGIPHNPGIFSPNLGLATDFSRQRPLRGRWHRAHRVDSEGKFLIGLRGFPTAATASGERWRRGPGLTPERSRAARRTVPVVSAACAGPQFDASHRFSLLELWRLAVFEILLLRVKCPDPIPIPTSWPDPPVSRPRGSLSAAWPRPAALASPALDS